MAKLLDYWEFVLLYVDDILCVSHREKEVLGNEIGKHFILKEASIGLLISILVVKLEKGILTPQKVTLKLGCSVLLNM